MHLIMFGVHLIIVGVHLIIVGVHSITVGVHFITVGVHLITVGVAREKEGTGGAWCPAGPAPFAWARDRHRSPFATPDPRERVAVASSASETPKVLGIVSNSDSPDASRCLNPPMPARPHGMGLRVRVPQECIYIYIYIYI